MPPSRLGCVHTTKDWSRDPAGSGPQPQYSFNAATNRVTNNGYQYDLAGDVLNDGYCSYTWDAEQHMSSATCPSNNTVTTTYVYDAQGQRVAKEVGGAVTEADVYNTAGQVVSRYGPYPAETWLGDDVWVGGAHLAIYANGQTYFPLTDQVGTERARFASTGGIVESCVSLPFGDGLQCTGSDSDPYHFGKLERDAETGDDHAQHRDYNSIPGRWLSPDPAGVKVVSLTDPQTWNLYVYSDNNPVTDNDPSGLQDCNHDGPCYEQHSFWHKLWNAAKYGHFVDNDHLNAALAKDAATMRQRIAAENLKAGNQSLNMKFLNTLSNQQVMDIGLQLALINVEGGDDAIPTEETEASTPVGRSGNPADVAPGTNSPTNIDGREYSGHALDQMQGRGIPSSVVEDTIQNGTSTAGNTPGETVHYSPTNNLSVVTDTPSGRVVTVHPGH